MVDSLLKPYSLCYFEEELLYFAYKFVCQKNNEHANAKRNDSDIYRLKFSEI